jgi:hypothetical protein
MKQTSYSVVFTTPIGRNHNICYREIWGYHYEDALKRNNIDEASVVLAFVGTPLLHKRAVESTTDVSHKPEYVSFAMMADCMRKWHSGLMHMAELLPRLQLNPHQWEALEEWRKLPSFLAGETSLARWDNTVEKAMAEQEKHGN